MSTEIHSSSISESPDGNSLFVDVLHEAPLSGHRKPTSLIGSIFYCFLLASFAVLAVGATWIFHPIERLVFPLLCSCNAALLLVTGIFQQYLVYQVKKIRLQGYYIFSQKLKHVIRLPFATIAYGTAAMLLVMVWDPHIGILSMLTLFRIVMLMEVVCVSSFMTVYIGCVHQYNSLDSQPDVLKSLYSPLQPSSSLEGLRYQDGGRLSDQQMALLQYQQENIHFLGEEILRLQETLSKYERCNDGSAPQVDLAHLLATRDQELRTLKAEMNQLQSELRLARSIVEEKDAEIQRIRNANNQYVEENERLRAILGEWSSRAAKLERALELERMSNLELQKNITTLKIQMCE
ncbi:protein FIP1 isoform X2 [Solanum lycopersicum]|uniref:protein FIP1 isoform X1 n=1 Tax=Solanum lycopersicum TaxID=4081 RepID=UPI00374897DC